MEINDMLKLSVTEGASDLHVLPGLPPLLRINGELITVKNQSTLSSSEVKNLLYGMMTEEQITKFETDLVLEMGLHFEDIGNFRASIFHQMNGIAGVFRVISDDVPSFDELGLPIVLKRLLQLSHGLILIAGPTGSGKSTTLAAMVDYINSTRASNIITIEDPIEYIHNSKKSAVNQLQVGRDTHDFATALRSSLRQDPDVILLGEMRDLDTIRLALTAAETGHLVLTTLHASSAPLAISRIVDIFPAAEKNRVRNLIAETLQAVVCQTLVKKISDGRIAAFEIMLATPAIRHLVRQDMVAHMESTIQTSGDVGMCTMDQYLQELVAKRLISSGVARSVSVNWGQMKND